MAFSLIIFDKNSSGMQSFWRAGRRGLHDRGFHQRHPPCETGGRTIDRRHLWGWQTRTKLAKADPAVIVDRVQELSEFIVSE